MSKKEEGRLLYSGSDLDLANRIAACGGQTRLDRPEDSVLDPLPSGLRPSGGISPGYGCDLGIEWIAGTLGQDYELASRPSVGRFCDFLSRRHVRRLRPYRVLSQRRVAGPWPARAAQLLALFGTRRSAPLAGVLRFR